MGWKRLIEYALVVLVAIILGTLLFWLWLRLTGQSSDECKTCTVSLPRLRAECDRQFFSSGSGSKQLEAQWELEEMIAYIEPSDETNASQDGYSSATGSQAAATGGPVVREPGYLMVRVQPQYTYTGQSSGPYSDLSSVAPETSWNDVTVQVARRVTPLRNEEVCNASVRFREGKFEFYCDLPTKFAATDFGQISFFVFVRNASSVPLEYCVVTNCDASSPWGAGQLCQAEQPQQ